MVNDQFMAAACAVLGHPYERTVTADDGRGGLVELRLCCCGRRRDEAQPEQGATR